MTKAVGFDQKVLLHHLDFTANEARKLTRKEMYEVLDNYLRNDIKGTKSRKNAITMLMKIWFIVDEEIISLRNKALELFPDLNKEERLLLHWGMVILAYPFFKDLVQKMGNLFRLQDEVPSAVVGRKMKELYGDRRRVEVATSAVLMSIKSWGIVEMLKGRSYKLPNKIHITNPDVQSFLVEVIIRATNVKAIPLDMVQTHTLFFPFQYDVSATELRESKVFQIDRQGIDMIMVELTS
ncbi:hypothetical protein JCM9140_3632 [Halalkalibacter wakoensis JCM 9140]|uniref:Uncharacterized protein n=1 Tax=Halalkalibacter wakoensis JCM 9140 TaxID=1236970 RepID=W4Q7Z9_9BACI|nr:hypothetical protein [Halalkalibacter wakoensis]GAE27484.1 hypothetical protein JCM9140_3632 [Halalkalibacter wakoensis JCM 9140]